MTTVQGNAVYGQGDQVPTYLDIQAEVGITKHLGGYEATNELYAFCQVDEAQEVLDVGCGIGVGPAYIAKRYACQVTAVDLSSKMLLWAQKRARRERVADRITFRQADVRQLPFEYDRFDAVIVESVLAFVKDKPATIRELARVTKPGGYIGLNESYWTRQPPAEVLAESFYGNLDIITEGEWRTIWEATDLEERTIKPHTLTPKQELRDRIKWIGWRSVLAAWGRTIGLLLTNPAARDSLKEQLDVPPELAALMEYALFVGRKPPLEPERQSG